MKIEQKIVKDTYEDVVFGISVNVDGKPRFCVRAGEPEDATFYRDLADCLDVVQLMREAHAAGARGEPFDVTESEEER